MFVDLTAIYAAWLKGGVLAVTNIKVKILMHIQTFIPVTSYKPDVKAKCQI